MTIATMLIISHWFMGLLVVTFVGLIVYSIYDTISSRNQTGKLAVNDRQYDYILGDNIFTLDSGVAVKHGLRIELPKYFPNMVFDSHFNEKIRGLSYTVDVSQRLHLEGDFDKYFAFYAPAGFEQLALSIVTPDLMQDLVNSKYLFDVEIINNEVVILSPTKLTKNIELQQAIVAFATEIMTRIDHRLESWSDIDSANSRNNYLNIIADEQIKIGRHTGLRQSVIFVYVISLPMASLFFYFAFWYKGELANGINMEAFWLPAGLLMFPFFPTIALIIERYLNQRRYKQNQVNINNDQLTSRVEKLLQ